MHDTPSQHSPEQAYYENDALWAQDFESHPDERIRLDFVTRMLPVGTQSVLDVGCGNGAFVNRIAGAFGRVCGVDRSEAALRFVRTEKKRAVADSLPFGDGEFDLVSCMEVIEHLPHGVYERALDELVRVAANWILVSVPFRENRRLGLVRCPACLCEFNRSYHLRDFDQPRMKTLFGGIDKNVVLVSSETVGEINYYFGMRVARRLAEPFRMLRLPPGVVCPQCQYRNGVQAPHSASAMGRADGLLGRARRVWPHVKRPRWLIGLYRKPEARDVPDAR